MRRSGCAGSTKERTGRYVSYPDQYRWNATGLTRQTLRKHWKPLVRLPLQARLSLIPLGDCLARSGLRPSTRVAWLRTEPLRNRRLELYPAWMAIGPTNVRAQDRAEPSATAEVAIG